MYAAEHRHVDLLKGLLSIGANVNKKDGMGFNVLDLILMGHGINNDKWSAKVVIKSLDVVMLYNPALTLSKYAKEYFFRQRIDGSPSLFVNVYKSINQCTLEYIQ